MVDLVIYHGGCADGTAAAWCFWRSVLNKDSSKLHYGKFGENPPDVTGKHVVFVDFTYPLEIIEHMLLTAASIEVFDHHKTAIPLGVLIKNPKFTLILDNSRSGAQIAWDYLNSDMPRPWYIEDIGDRDLWTWKIPESKESTTGMFAMNYYESMESFDKLQNTNRSEFVLGGRAVLSNEERNIQSIVKRAIPCVTKFDKPDGSPWKVKLVECEHMQASEVGSRLVADDSCDFAVAFRYDFMKNEWWLSCRAKSDNFIDLTTILPNIDKKSGGHAKAAGATIRGYEGFALSTFFKPM